MLNVFKILGSLKAKYGIYYVYGNHDRQLYTSSPAFSREELDEAITENKLQTKGIYSYVRNPMYSGWWILLSGIILMWHNWVMLILPVIDWVIMTIAIINTEEKWLLDLYGEEYADYKKRVNRFIPWKRRR